MRRSKSVPSKTVRQYRKVSQRRMTDGNGLWDDDDDNNNPETSVKHQQQQQAELVRLRELLSSTEHKLQQHNNRRVDKNDQNDAFPSSSSSSSKTKKKTKSATSEAESQREIPEPSVVADGDDDSDNPYDTTKDDLVILPDKKKKKSSPKKTVELTPAEVKQAKKLYQQTQRKLKQLEDRATRKAQRATLYQQLEQSQLTSHQRLLLQSSATLGQDLSRKQQLRQLIRKERAGLTLTAEEHALLYQDRTADPIDNVVESKDTITTSTTVPKQQQPKDEATAEASDQPPLKKQKTASPSDNNTTESGDVGDDATAASAKTKKKKKKERKLNNKHNVDSPPSEALESSSNKRRKLDRTSSNRKDDDAVSTDATQSRETPTTMDSSVNANKDTAAEAVDDDEEQQLPTEATEDDSPVLKEASPPQEKTAEPPATSKSASSFASQLMASLASLKCSTDSQANAKKADTQSMSELERLAETMIPPEKPYIPSVPAELKAPGTLGVPVHELKSNRRVLPVTRPEEIQVARYNLPVATMEFEVMDTIRNNDVTIICGETGSGKSTQVPQFLYEAGLTLPSSAKPGRECSSSAPHFRIGITQPRRVAAVSTATRVCYEMGHGDGQSIRNTDKKDGNVVAYQTRYETAGLGDSTCIKFMTDGILLQEIQSDILLRKYSVICIDEAHERNLNSDALIGLLSVAIPLRKKAAEEEGSQLVPLKLVIMSATLRVSDFTENKKLFPYTTPAVLRIPGRTFPVTIHHSKTTVMEDYEDAAFRKTCKIHRQLPQGGILIFLTGKQEIIRMVRRLRKALSDKQEPAVEAAFSNKDVTIETDAEALRDMDDDEVDGDLFDENNRKGGNDTDVVEDAAVPQSDDDSNVPRKAIVLPLYSLLSTEEQSKVFAPVPEGHRLIVVATNVAETSITIPNVTYVVDTGRQKIRNYSSGTGVASYEITWISRAAADQRSGRAGRTSAGHCYRLYSSSMYGRHMDPFALPEVLTRPLEDVVLAMKAMRIDHVSNFPFPTPPDKEQVDSALTLLANLGCLDLSKAEEEGHDGIITRLGESVSKLPLGVRYSKMLLVAAEAGVLDYAIATVAALSEASPFVVNGQQLQPEEMLDDEDESNSDEIGNEDGKRKERKKNLRLRWTHRRGDVLAVTMAVGAYAYAARGHDGITPQIASRRFCEDNGLHPVIMSRIHKMRVHLARLAKTRLSAADGIASKSGGVVRSMKPPSKVQEVLLVQAIASGLLDHVAMLAPLGSIPGEYSFSLRTAYIGCTTKPTTPLLMDRNSFVYSRDPRQLPKWICYDSLIRKTTKDGAPITVMKNITPIDPSSLGTVAQGSRLLELGHAVYPPVPSYDIGRDLLLCSVQTKFGNHGWELDPVQVEMYPALNDKKHGKSMHFLTDDSFRWFARYLLEGKVLPELEEFAGMNEHWNDSLINITRRTPSSKVTLLVSALAREGIDSAGGLQQHWAKQDPKFLWPEVQMWVRKDSVSMVKQRWKKAVKQCMLRFKKEKGA